MLMSKLFSSILLSERKNFFFVGFFGCDEFTLLYNQALVFSLHCVVRTISIA